MAEDTPFQTEYRRQARAHATDGIALLARALNHCQEDAQAHRYAAEVQERFLELAGELVALVESGRIERNPGHARHQLLLSARGDTALQALLHRAGA